MTDNGDPEYASTLTCYGRIRDQGEITTAVANDDFVSTTVGSTALVIVSSADLFGCAPEIVEGPTDGTLSAFQSSGSGWYCYYYPDSDYHGVDTFTYKYPTIYDGQDPILYESRTATVSIAVDPMVVEVGVEGEYDVDELGNRRAIMPENVDWFEQGTLGGSRVADNMHEGIDFYDYQLRDATVSITNNFPVDVTGYWCPTFITYAGGWSIENYGSRIRAYQNVDSQWEEIFTYERFMVTLEPNETLVVPLILEGISSTGLDDLTFTVDFHVVNIDSEYLHGGLRSVPDTCDRIALAIESVDLAVGPTNAPMPELFEDDLPYVVPMNRDYDLGYVDGQGQPVADGVGGTNMLPVNWSVDDELIETAIHFPFPFHGTWTLIIPPDLRVWNSATRERVVSGTAYEFSSTLWCMSVGLRIEGVMPSATPDNFLIVSAQFTDAQGASLGTPITDRTKYEVVSIDLEIAEISELDEETQPAFVPLNDDYDEVNIHIISGDEVADNNRLFDQLVSVTPRIDASDDDLVCATLTIDGPNGQTGRYWIEVLNEPVWLQYPDWPGYSQYIRIWQYDGVEVPRDEANALPITLDEELDLLIEGLALSQCELALKAHFIPDGDYDAAGVFPVVTDDAEAIPVKIDLDIDSDNNNGYDPPARTAYEDEIEDKTAGSYPGKFIAVNDNDNDGDGIPDFADGFNQFGGTSSQTVGEDFVPLVIELPSPIDLSQASLRILYNASDPKNVDRTGSGTESAPYVYTTDAGNLRIWTKDGSTVRNKNDVSDAENPGDFVYPETYNDLSKLGFVGVTRTVTLYVEGINASSTVGSNTIKVEVDPDGEGPQGFSLVDVVRTTVVGLNMTVYNGGSDLDIGERARDDGTAVAESREETVGAYLLVNWDDDDADCRMNADGSFAHLPVPDLNETYVANEDNLAKITFAIDPLLLVMLDHCVAELEVTQGADKIKLWESKQKGSEIKLVNSIRTWGLSNESQIQDFLSRGEFGIWIEGIASSAAERDVTIVLRFKYNGQEIVSDTVKATVVMIDLGNVVGREVNSDGLAERGHVAIVGRFNGPCSKEALIDASNYTLYESDGGQDWGTEPGPREAALTHVTACPGREFFGSLEPFITSFYNATSMPNTVEGYRNRLRILSVARWLVDHTANIGYVKLSAMSHTAEGAWSGALNTISALRCDGFVEVCYEYCGVNSWRRLGSGYSILVAANQSDHNEWRWGDDPEDGTDDFWAWLMPITQIGYADTYIGLHYPQYTGGPLEGTYWESAFSEQQLVLPTMPSP